MTIIEKSAELGADVLEPIIDGLVESLSDSQVLKDVPILGTAVKIAALGKSIADRIFLKKVQRFLQGIDGTTIERASTFARELETGDADAVRTAETLVLAIDAMNDMEKAPLLAAVFASFLRGEISKPDFRRLIAAINSAVVDDLSALAAVGPEATGKVDKLESVMSSLRHTGLTIDASGGIRLQPYNELSDTVTDLGKTFLRVVNSQKR